MCKTYYHRHPSIVEKISTASYKLKRNNLFRTNKTDFSIFDKKTEEMSHADLSTGSPVKSDQDGTFS